MKSYQK